VVPAQGPASATQTVNVRDSKTPPPPSGVTAHESSLKRCPSPTWPSTTSCVISRTSLLTHSKSQFNYSLCPVFPALSQSCSCMCPQHVEVPGPGIEPTPQQLFRLCMVRYIPSIPTLDSNCEWIVPSSSIFWKSLRRIVWGCNVLKISSKNLYNMSRCSGENPQLCWGEVLAQKSLLISECPRGPSMLSFVAKSKKSFPKAIVREWLSFILFFQRTEYSVNRC
uniref:holocytochrome-c synthase n=1 Tax=Sus scrofa TaxID=9823 RepID=A0A8D1NXM6_PIG